VVEIHHFFLFVGIHTGYLREIYDICLRILPFTVSCVNELLCGGIDQNFVGGTEFFVGLESIERLFVFFTVCKLFFALGNRGIVLDTEQRGQLFLACLSKITVRKLGVTEKTDLAAADLAVFLFK
jgi:hypothetical protein